MKVVVMKSRGYNIMIVLSNSYQGTDNKTDVRMTIMA